MHPQRPNELIFLPTESQKHIKRNAALSPKGFQEGLDARNPRKHVVEPCGPEAVVQTRVMFLQAAENNVILVPTEALQNRSFPGTSQTTPKQT